MRNAYTHTKWNSIRYEMSERECRASACIMVVLFHILYILFVALWQYFFTSAAAGSSNINHHIIVLSRYKDEIKEKTAISEVEYLTLRTAV